MRDGSATADIDTDPGTAWLWTPQDGMFNLNDLVDVSGFGLYLRNATSINDLGQIVGWAEVVEADSRPGEIIPFLLTPIPEPRAGCFIALSMLAIRRRRE